MNTILWSFIRDNLGEIVFIIFLLAVYVTYFVTRTNSDIKYLKESVYRLSESINRLSEDVSYLTGLIVERFGPSVAKTESPITLTEYGETISKAVDAPEIVKIYAPKVKELVSDVEDMNAYEIQAHCFSYAKDELPEELKKNNKAIYEKVAGYAYDKGIDMDKITRVIGIQLRDQLLESLNIPRKEIDKHTAE